MPSMKCKDLEGEISVYFNRSRTKPLFLRVAACSLVETDRRFRNAYCLHHQDDRPRRIMFSCVNGVHIRAEQTNFMLHAPVTMATAKAQVVTHAPAIGTAVRQSCTEARHYGRNRCRRQSKMLHKKIQPQLHGREISRTESVCCSRVFMSNCRT
jgi:hypothetical protein